MSEKKVLEMKGITKIYPLVVKDGYLETCKAPGTGVVFDLEKLNLYKVN